MIKFTDRNVVKAIWAFSAIIAVGLGLLLPSPAMFGLGKHHLIHVGAPQE
jgi:hypothetical protein